MKLRSEHSIWRGGESHSHHRVTPRHATAANWARVAKRHSRLIDPQPGGYPSDVLAVFRDAVARCPTICIERDVMNGEPCVEGTRIPVRRVLRAVEQYGSIENAIKCYPDLNAQQLKDALYFAQIVLEPLRGIDEVETTD